MDGEMNRDLFEILASKTQQVFFKQNGVAFLFVQ